MSMMRLPLTQVVPAGHGDSRPFWRFPVLLAAGILLIFDRTGGTSSLFQPG